MDEKINVNINDGEAFYSNETSISHNPVQFVLDFKQITPRIDMRSQQSQLFCLKHNVILIDPLHAKRLSDMMQAAIKEYENKFGKIEATPAIKKFEKENKKEANKSKPKTVKAESPSYFG